MMLAHKNSIKTRHIFVSSVSAVALAAGLYGALNSSASAQVTYAVGSDPSVADSSQIIDQRQLVSTSEVEAITSSTSVGSSIVAGGAVTVDTSLNSITALDDGNVLDPDPDNATPPNEGPVVLDIATATGSGGSSNAVIASVQEFTDSNIFAQINSGASIANSVTAPGDSSTVTLDGNLISADIDINDADNRLVGDLAATFSNTDVGSYDPAGPLDAAATTSLGGLDAGLVIGNFQIGRSVDNATTNNPPGGIDAFASIDDTASISNDIIGNGGGGPYGDALTIDANDNTIQALFDGNTGSNLLRVENGGDPLLEASAGIASVQINDEVETTGELSAVVGNGVDAVSISTVISSSVADVFTDSTADLTGNEIAAVSNGNVVSSILEIESGVSVDSVNSADADVNNLMDLDASDLTTEGGLFLANVQRNVDTTLNSTIDSAGNDILLQVDEGLLRSVLTSDGNTIRTQTLGNNAEGSITVSGASDIDSTVSAANLQIFEDDALADGESVLALTQDANIAVDAVNDADSTVADSTITNDANAITSLAIASRDPLEVSLTASNSITDDGFSEQPSTTRTTGEALDATAGLSAVSGQLISGRDSDIVIRSETTSAAVTTSVGSAGDNEADDTTVTLVDNEISASALGNLGEVSLTADSGNSFDASSAVVAAQRAGVSDDVLIQANAGGSVTGDISSGDADASGLTLTVGDPDLTDGTPSGNVIGSSASGQSNIATLDITAGGTLSATGTIDSSGAVPDVVSLDVLAAAGDSATAAEMALYTDQRLSSSGAPSQVAATTFLSTVRGDINQGANALSGSTISVDGNTLSSDSEGNATTNLLAFDASDVDMSAADANGGIAAGTNLAAMGAAQANEADVLATLVGGTILSTASGTGNVTAVTITADANTGSAVADGNTASNTLEAGGSTLQTTADADIAQLRMTPASTDPDLEIDAVMLATGVAQQMGDDGFDGGDVIAQISDTFAVTASANASLDVSNSTLSADDNLAIAQATGNDSTATTELAFSDITSSAAIGVQQTGTDGVQASVVAVDINTLASGGLAADVTLTADRNDINAVSTGATSTSTLSADAANALASGSAGSGTTRLETGNTAAGEFDILASADFMSVTQQSVGTTTSNIASTQIDVTTAVLRNAALSADANSVVAQTTGAETIGTLSLSGSDLSAGAPADAATASLLSDQATTGPLLANVGNSGAGIDITVTAGDLTGGGTNGAESLSADDNAVATSVTGLSADNDLAVTATAGQGGLVAAGAVSLDADGSDSTDLLLSGTADQLIVSNQLLPGGAAGDISSQVFDARIFVDGGVNVDGDTLTADGNVSQARSVSAESDNTLTSTSGIGSVATSAIVANQERGAAKTDVSNSTDIEVSATGTANASVFSASSNRIDAVATDLLGSNTLNVSAGTSVTGDAATGSVDLSDGVDIVSGGDVQIVSRQNGGSMTSDGIELIASSVLVELGSNVTSVTASADANVLLASGTGLDNTNTLDLAADGPLFEADAVIAARQNLTGSLEVELFGDDGAAEDFVSVVVGGTVTDSALSVSGNTVQLDATGAVAENDLSAVATGASTGANEAASMTLDTSLRGGVAAFIAADGDRLLVSDQTAAGGTVVTAELSVTETGAELRDPDMRLSVGGNVLDSSLLADSNTYRGAASGLEATNTLDASAGLSISDGAGLASLQDSPAAIEGTLNDPDITVTTNGGSVTGSVVSLASNLLEASADGLAATNALSMSGLALEGSADETVDVDLVGNEINAAPVGMASLLNAQQQSGGVTASVGQESDDTSANENAELTIDTGLLLSSTVGADANTVNALASGIAADNDLSQSSSTSMDSSSNANITSVQELTGAGVSGSVTGLTIAVDIDGTVDASTATVNDNDTLASATGAEVANSLSVDAQTSLSGGGSVNPTLSFNAGIFANSVGDTDTASIQRSAASVSATVEPGTDSGGAPDAFPSASLSISGVTGGTTASTATVDGNRFRALATNLTATNDTTVSAGTSNSRDIALFNAQEVAGTTSATGSGAAASLSADAFTGTASVSDNVVAAAATGGSATNSVSTSSGTDLTQSFAGGAVAGNLQGAGSALEINATSADPLVTLGSAQLRTQAVTASLTDGNAGAAPGAIRASATFTGAVDGAVNLDDNVFVSQARGLQATNTVTGVAGNDLTNASMTVVNLQEGEAGGVSSTINAGSTAGTDDGGVFLTTVPNNLTGAASLDQNIVQATAAANRALNSLDVSAGNNLSVGTQGTSLIDSGSGNNMSSIDVGFSVMNGQLSATQVTASISNMDVEASVQDLTGSATLDSNTMFSEARGNFADNVLNLTASNALTGSSALLNTQDATGDADISASVNTGRIGITTDGMVGAVSVSDNGVTASAVQNDAINSVAIQASTLQTAGGGSTSGGPLQATADAVALNNQTNAGDVTAVVNNYGIDATLNGSGTGVGDTARVDNNSVAAFAVGNRAANDFTVSAAGSARGDYAFNSNQANTGNAISARVSGVTIGATANNATGTYSVRGNTISATARGNVATTGLRSRD